MDTPPNNQPSGAVTSQEARRKNPSQGKFRSGINAIPGGMLNVSTDGEAGLTLNMTATPEQRENFINE